MYNFIFKPRAQKQFDKLPQIIRKRITVALERTRKNPKKYFLRLTGELTYRLRVGDYRIIAEIHNNQLIILVIKIDKKSFVPFEITQNMDQESGNLSFNYFTIYSLDNANSDIEIELPEEIV